MQNDQNKKISMKEIAVLCGVSVATVSRAINNTGRISDETKRHVLEIIDQYDYSANMAAKSLRESRSKSIGVIVPDISNEFFSKITLKIETFFYEKGYSVFICNSANDPEKEKAYFKSLDSKLVDGILFISGQKNISKDLISRNIPFVCIDRYPYHELNLPNVTCDGIMGSYIGTELLIKKGCKRILTIRSNTGNYSQHKRLKGYENALKDYSIPLDDNLLFSLKGPQSSYIEAENIIDRCLEKNIDFDAIFAFSDRAAYGALTSLKKNNIDIPGKVKLVGFDDSLYSRLASPTITTIRQDTDLLANLSSQLLYDVMTGTKELTNEQIVIPVTLIERETT